jgi:hypothetical protein
LKDYFKGIINFYFADRGVEVEEEKNDHCFFLTVETPKDQRQSPQTSYRRLCKHSQKYLYYICRHFRCSGINLEYISILGMKSIFGDDFPHRHYLLIFSEIVTDEMMRFCVNQWRRIAGKRAKVIATINTDMDIRNVYNIDGLIEYLVYVNMDYSHSPIEHARRWTLSRGLARYSKR